MTTRTLTHPLKILAVVGLALPLWGLLLAYAPGPAWASTITVNSLKDTAADDGQCTLTEAITSANANAASGETPGECAAGSGADVIGIGEKGTVNLTGALPDLSSNMKIEGLGADEINVRRDTGGQYRIFTIEEDKDVFISGMTISNGELKVGHDQRFLRGGGIYNDGSLEISRSKISNNNALRVGGGIYNGRTGDLTVDRSTIGGNEATTGGGVFDDSKDAAGDRQIVRITRSTISNNHAALNGGGVYSNHEGVLRMKVTNSTFSENDAANEGGAISVDGGLMTVTSSTFSGNKADRGGALYNGTTSDVYVRSSILTKNEGRNCDSRNKIHLPGIDDLRNPDIFYGFENGRYNAVDDFSCWGTRGHLDREYIELDPAGLQDNGGSTKTIALLPTSAAIDRIPELDNGCGAALNVDQRGVTRPQGNRCDIGAFEKRSNGG